MLQKYTIIGVKCDECGEYYPNTKSPVHFADEESASKTLRENGWTVGETHVCPACKSATEFVTSYFKRNEN